VSRWHMAWHDGTALARARWRGHVRRLVSGGA